MSKTKIFGIVAILASILLVSPSAQAASDTEALQPVAPAEAIKIGDLGSYFDEYSSYMQLDTALHSSETMHIPDVHIGGQGVGGVTFFNGTIVNETTDENGGNLAVTFGDTVRIDDYIYRNAPGAADEMPVLIGDGLSPALDDSNALGESDRRWQYLYVSDNIDGDDVVHEDNLSVTNTPTTNQILSYAGSNRFTWVDAVSALGSTTTRSDGSDAEDGDVLTGEDSDGDGDVDDWSAGDLEDLIDDAIDGARDGGALIPADRVAGDFDGVSRELRIETGITPIVDACAQIGYTNANRIHDDFATDFTSTATYTVTATYYTGAEPSASPQTDVYPIDIVKDTDNGGFYAYTCFPNQTGIMWQAIGY
ncbi:MAG: hypothetical protein HQ538_01685 [Parcubacteria group bacterium]|nr:hypothetical protein [Parcubacteria group bacterium]